MGLDQRLEFLKLEILTVETVFIAGKNTKLEKYYTTSRKVHEHCIVIRQKEWAGCCIF